MDTVADNLHKEDTATNDAQTVVKDDISDAERRGGESSEISMTSEEHELPATKNRRSSKMEYIIAMRTEFINKKIVNDFPIKDVITQEDLDTAKKTYELQLEKFTEKFGNCSFFDEYHQMIVDNFYRHYEKLMEIYEKCELEICKQYVETLRTEIISDNEFKKLQNDICTRIVSDQYEELNAYKKNTLAKVDAYIQANNFIIRNAEFILSVINEIFETRVKKCDTIVRWNMQYYANFMDIVKKFIAEIKQNIDDIEIDSFSDSQDEIWDDLEDTMEGLCDKYIKMPILYNVDNMNPPKQLRGIYEDEIRRAYDKYWLDCVDDIKVNKNREKLQEDLDDNKNFVGDKCKYPKIVKMSDMSCVAEEFFILNNEQKMLEDIVRRCKLDVFYVGRVNMIVTKLKKQKREFHVCENSIITNCIKSLKIENGLYTRETIPQFLVRTDNLISKIFATIPVGENKIYIIAPANLEKFTKFVEFINCIRIKEEVETYFDFQMEDIKLP